MFNNNFLRKDTNIGFASSFELLPAICFTKTGKYFEINIQWFNLFIHFCYSSYNVNIEDD